MISHRLISLVKKKLTFAFLVEYTFLICRECPYESYIFVVWRFNSENCILKIQNQKSPYNISCCLHDFRKSGSFSKEYIEKQETKKNSNRSIGRRVISLLFWIVKKCYHWLLFLSVERSRAFAGWLFSKVDISGNGSGTFSNYKFGNRMAGKPSSSTYTFRNRRFWKRISLVSEC